MTVDFPERLHKHAHDLDTAGHDVNASGSISITDGSTTVDPATDITFDGATVTDDGGGAATVQFSPGGSVDAIDVVFDPSNTSGLLTATNVQAAIDETLEVSLNDSHRHGLDEFTGDGVETLFTLAASYASIAGGIRVYFDGLRQSASVVIGVNDDGGAAQVEFGSPPGNAVVIIIDWQEASDQP